MPAQKLILPPYDFVVVRCVDCLLVYVVFATRACDLFGRRHLSLWFVQRVVGSMVIRKQIRDRLSRFFCFLLFFSSPLFVI